MLRITSAACLVLVVGVPSRADEKADEMKRLEGVWQAVEVQVKGKTLGKDDEVKALKFVIAGDLMTIPSPRDDGKERKKKFTVDPAKSPKHMDITSLDGQEKDQTAACIYKLEKDKLTVCIPYFTKDPSQRPKEFKAGADDGLMVIVLERVKK